MKQAAYALILLTFWAQFDDVVLPLVLASQSAALAADDDEYLSCERQEQSAPRRQFHIAIVKPRTAGHSCDQTDLSSERRAAALVARSSLYVFMSLQI
jgi:hypothetical protein